MKLILPLMMVALTGTCLAQTGFPFQDESLHYSVNWPSGLSLGDAAFTAHHGASGWEFELTLTASVPGFSISDKVHSMAANDLCSTEMERSTSHGSKKSREKTTFDQKNGTAHRVTLLPADGGRSDFNIPSCARDALTLSYYARRELGQGRVPAPQTTFFGSAYTARMDYTGAQTITVGGKSQVTDHVVVTVKGPKSDFTAEVFYARDAARTPVEMRIPLALGALSVELVR